MMRDHDENSESLPVEPLNLSNLKQHSTWSCTSKRWALWAVVFDSNAFTTLGLASLDKDKDKDKFTIVNLNVTVVT